MAKDNTKKIIGINFKDNPKRYNFWGPEEDLEIGDTVLVETPVGSELARVVSINGKNSTKPTQKIIRKVSIEERETLKLSENEKNYYLKEFISAIKKYGIEMKPVGVEVCVQGRLIFIFSSEKRVDFRDIVKDLIHKLEKQVVLKQIGARDAARCLDGHGPCGRRVCCRQFLGASEGVTMDMAREQGMSQKGAGKISGNCGRLMCCLKFEEKYYKDALKKMPSEGSKIKTEKGEGVVVSVNPISSKVEVLLKDKTKMEVEI